MQHTDKCTYCAQTFLSDLELYLHKLKTLHKCEECKQQEFKSKVDVRKHMKAHKPHRCTVCKKGFFLKCSVSDHMRSSHRKRTFLQDLTQYGKCNLRQILKEMVEPKREAVTKSKEVIDDIVDFLHGLNVAKMFTKHIVTLKVNHIGERPCKELEVIDDIEESLQHRFGQYVREVTKKEDVYTILVYHEYNGNLRDVIEYIIKMLQHNIRLDVTFVSVKEDGYNLVVDYNDEQHCREVSKEILDFVKSLNVAEIFKGGSLAKRTNIKLKGDIDLVMFLNNTTMAELKSGMKKRLIYLKELLLIFFSNLTFEPGPVTRHSIHSESDVPHAVDLLPAVDLIAHNQYGSKEAIYRVMKKATKSRPFYSSCLTKFQVEFVKDQLKEASELRSLIRLVKHWKVTEDLLQRKSYSVELIVIKLWQDWGRPKSFDLTEKFREVMGEMSRLGKTKITWPNEYHTSQPAGLHGGMPVIMDPANPYGNTAQKLKKNEKAIKRIEKRAQETLQHL